MTENFLFAAIFVVTYFGVRAFIGWSRRRKFYDIPNERSSHTRPTPRGGGAVIVAVCLCFYTLYTVFFKNDFLWQFAVGAILIASISWLDDRRSISFVWRILIHAAAACLVIQSLSESGSFAEFRETPRWLKFFIEVSLLLWIVWLTNAYNFMDGIDGIAGAQAVTAGLGWMFAGRILQLDTIGFFGGALAVSCFGFLIFNWQPAKVFMGDVGSAFLGFSFACLPFFAARDTTSENTLFRLMLGCALIWLFLFDTGLTLARRLLRGENFWHAHRSHLYQQLTASGLSHSFVALLYGALSVLNAAVVVAAAADKKYIYALLFAVPVEAVGLILFLRIRREKTCIVANSKTKAI